MKNIDYGIYLVTDDRCLKGSSLIYGVEAALQGGVTLVQYRGKDKSGYFLYQEAKELKQLCDKYNVPLIINDRIDIALLVGAAGVHLGQDDIPCREARKILGSEFIIGVSAHNVQEAQQAVADGADYLGSGAVFGSQTKTDVNTLGLDNLKKICTSVNIPVVGIGGITSDNYGEVLKAGACGAAVVSGILGAYDIKAAAETFRNILYKYKK